MKTENQSTTLNMPWLLNFQTAKRVKIVYNRMQLYLVNIHLLRKPAIMFLKLLTTFSLFILLFDSALSQTSSLVGGEISWACLGNGRFVFYMKIFRDCDQSPHIFSNKKVWIKGSPLPRSSTNNILNYIILKPDSNTFINNRRGDTAPQECNGSASFQCSNGDGEVMQQFFYQSDPIVLRGNPPNDGWIFYFKESEGRRNLANLADTSSLYLRAIMYPIPGVNSMDPCMDSSPVFLAYPDKLFCAKDLISENFGLIDIDQDRLRFQLDSALSVEPGMSSTSSIYRPGFSYLNPTPNASLDPKNTTITIDSISGHMQQELWSYDTSNPEYSVVVRVDSWRDSAKISSVYREMPFQFIDCDLLPTFRPNRLARVVMNEDTSDNVIVDAIVGQNLGILVEFQDDDSLTSGFQNLTTLPVGFNFSRDLQNPNYCFTQSIEPCAYLENLDPRFNSVAEPPRFELNANGVITSTLNWQLSCSSIDSSGGKNFNQRHSTFVFKTFDDHCPVPKRRASSLTIRVKESMTNAPFPLGMSANLDGTVTVQWIPPLDSMSNFDHYELAFSTPAANFPPQSSSQLDSNLQLFSFEKTYADIGLYPLNPQNQPDLLQADLSKDYYFKMRSFSGCFVDYASSYSHYQSLMKLDLTAVGNPSNGRRSMVRLKWNKAGLFAPFYHENIFYNSGITYYVWQNTDMDSLNVEQDWSLMDSTKFNQIDLQANLCGDYAAYRIEARDTFFVLPQGEKIRGEYDTLYSSTFSLMDSIYLKQAKSRIKVFPFDSLSSSQTAKGYQWINCFTAQPIPNANASSFIPGSPGAYRLAIDGPICRDTSECVVVDSINTEVEVPANDLIVAKDSAYRYQWIDCRADTVIPGATDQQLILQDTGYYAVVMFAYGFSDTSDCIPMLSVGLDEKMSLQDEITLYPNPNKGVVFIDRESASTLDYQIFNIQGKLMKRGSLAAYQKQIELPEAEGLYFVSLRDEQENERTFKVMKH